MQLEFINQKYGKIILRTNSYNAGYLTIVTDFWSKCMQSYTILNSLIDYESVARLVE